MTPVASDARGVCVTFAGVREGESEGPHRVSSLRIDSLRLVWLEAFIQVENAENISEAARNWGVDQSTVSRHMLALEKWLGKKLIEAGAVKDPEDARVNVGLTDAGREFHPIAVRILDDLKSFRTDEARREELLESMATMITKMQSDLNGKRASAAAQSVQDQITMQGQFLEVLKEGAPLEAIETICNRLRQFFATYEKEKVREMGRARKRVGRGSRQTHSVP